ncbi:MAG: hypothetical protein DWQ04_18325, partial [Chloroflexi bacterium]
MSKQPEKELTPASVEKMMSADEVELASAVVTLGDDAEAISVAPNWKLVWWRFKKHKLALVGGVVIIFIAIMAIFPEFFSTHDPNETVATDSFIPVQTLHFWRDGRFQLHVLDVEGKRNPDTLRMEWFVSEENIVPLRLWAHGVPYELFGRFETDI